MARGTALVALTGLGENPDRALDSYLDEALEPHMDDGEDGSWEDYEHTGMLTGSLAEAVAGAAAIVTPNGEWINRATWDGPRPDFDAVAQAALADHDPAAIAVITYRT